MKRSHVSSLVLVLLISSALACTSHQRSPASSDNASPPAVKNAAAVSNTAAPAAASKPALPARALAVASRPGLDGEPSASPSEAAARARANEQAKKMAAGGGPFASQAVAFGESPAVRDLPRAASSTDLTDLDRERAEGPDNPEVRRLVPSVRTMGKKDAALQSATAVNALTPPIVSVDGLNNTDNFNAFGGRVNPSDDNGDVGPHHYVQQINLLVRVYDKAGAPLTPPFKLSSLFAPIGGQCAIQDAGDPVVLYDPLADRWFLSQFAFASLGAPPYHECVAVSKTADPTGAYYVYDFVTAGNEFPDYPHIGVWPDAYYMMVHQFTNGGPFNGTGMYALDRKKMLAGDPTAGYIYFNENLALHPEGIGGGLFADVDGLTPPAPGAPGIFAYFTSVAFGDPADGIRLFEFHADFANPGNSTFTEPQTSYAAPLAVAAFDPTNPAGRRDIPQPPPTTITASLDSIADRFLHRMAYRNFGDHESFVLNHTVGAPASTVFGTFRAGVRYYELRRVAGTFAVNEQATFAPADGVNRWMASAAMDHEGNIGIGFSVSSTSVFPGIRYAGRLASDPPGGLFQGESLLIAGTGVQTTTNNRWGDYSGMGVDPTDDCTFWFTDEYYTAASQATSGAGWLTRIGSFKVDPGCVAPPQGTLNGTVTFCDTGLPATGALVEISDGHTAPVTAAGTYSITLSPGTYTVHVTGPSCTPTSPASVTVTNGGTTTYNTCLTGSPNLEATNATVVGGNGNGVIDKDECNKLFITLTNFGCLTDTGITATLSTSTPGVTITQPFSPYPNIPEGGSANNTVPFEISTSPSFACGTPVDLTLTVHDLTGTHVFTGSLPSCVAPPIVFTGSIDNSDPTQNLRIFRDGVQSSCGAPKPACPGTTGSGTRHYDAHNVTNTGGVTACVRVDVAGPCSAGGGSGLNIFSTTYLGSFNPANICQNYLADEGASFGGTGTYFFDLPAGQTAVIVVNEVNSGQGCSSYHLTVSGLFDNADGGGACATVAACATCDSPVQADPYPITNCSGGDVKASGATVINLPAKDVVLQCALAELPGTDGIKITANSIKVDGPNGGSITTNGKTGTQLTAATTIDLESTSVLDNNPNGGLKLTAGGDVVVKGSTVKAANSATLDATSTGGKICSRENTLGGNVVALTASGPVGSGDVTLVGTAVQVTNARSGIKLTSSNGSVLASGLAGCPPNSFTSAGNDGNMTVSAKGVAFLGNSCVDVAENVTVTAAGAGKDCAGDIIIDLTDAVVRNDFGKTGVITMTACGGSGLIETNNAILADAGAKGGGTDPNAVSNLNGGKKTDPLAPPCTETPACGGPVNQPVSADQTDRNLHHVVGVPRCDS